MIAKDDLLKMYKNCIICDTIGIDLGEKHDYNLYTKEDPTGVTSGIRKTYHYKECPNCGLSWVDDPDDNYNKLYESDEYWWEYHKRRGWNSIDEDPRIINDIKYSVLRMEAIKKHITSGAAIEFGCSTGTLLYQLQVNGFNTTGVEPNPKVCEQAAQFGKCTVIQGDSFKCRDILQPNAYDLIVAIDLFEHLLKPIENAKIWVDLLKPKGIIMLELPDASCEGYTKHKIAWDYAIPTEHMFNYKPDHIDEIFHRLGCETIEFCNPWTTDRMRFFIRKI